MLANNGIKNLEQGRKCNMVTSIHQGIPPSENVDEEPQNHLNSRLTTGAKTKH